MNQFSSFGFSTDIIRALDDLNIQEPTPIQAKAIPILKDEWTDMIGLAQTGTGKTAAFALPLIHRVDPKNGAVQVLIVCPTRELGQQIATEIDKFTKYLPKLGVLAIYGGANISTQIKALKKNIQIVIATPGRLMDLMRRKAIRLDSVSYFVLDEADEMLRMGFREDIDFLLDTMKKQEHLTWLFSATLPPEIRTIVNTYMRPDRAEVKVSSGREVNKNITHQYVMVKSAEKKDILVRIIQEADDMYGIVFCRTKLGAQKLSNQLMEQGFMADALHGDLSQKQRDMVMGRFKRKQINLLIATDVAARGIDVDGVTHVFHYNIPDNEEYYTHRSGRTARAGNDGLSISLTTTRDRAPLLRFGDKLGIKFEKRQAPSIASLIEDRMASIAKSYMNRALPDQFLEDCKREWVEQFDDIDKEELVLKLVYQEYQKWESSLKREKNEARKSKRDSKRNDDDRGEIKDKKKSRNKKDVQFYINLGKRDNIGVGELLSFLEEQGGIQGENVRGIEMKSGFSLFSVNSKLAKSVRNRFNDILVNGRPLVVKRDEPSGHDESFYSPKKRKTKRGTKVKGKRKAKATSKERRNKRRR